jgi:hypothetical protein
VRRPGAHGGERVGGGESQVVVRVHLDVDIDHRTQARDALVRAKWVEHTQRVGKAQPAGGGGGGGLGHAQQKVLIGARGILGAHAHRKAGVAPGLHVTLHLPECPGAVAAELVRELDVRHRQRQVQQRHRAGAGGGEIVRRHARPHHQARPEPGGGDGGDGLALRPAHGRDADFKFRHAGRSERPGDGQLLVDSERHAGGLLAVAQRGVVDDDRWQWHGVGSGKAFGAHNARAVPAARVGRRRLQISKLAGLFVS